MNSALQLYAVLLLLTAWLGTAFWRRKPGIGQRMLCCINFQMLQHATKCHKPENVVLSAVQHSLACGGLLFAGPLFGQTCSTSKNLPSRLTDACASLSHKPHDQCIKYYETCLPIEWIHWYNVPDCLDNFCSQCLQCIRLCLSYN